MHIDRILNLNIGEKKDSKYVMYWMQQAVRVNYNHALDFAIKIANKKKLPLVVCFVLTKNYLGANLRHYKFMLEGLKEVSEELDKIGIAFVIKTGYPSDVIINMLDQVDSLIMDYGYLKPQLKWRRDIYDYIMINSNDTSLYLIESDVLVPVKKAYPKLAYGAYVLRPHIMRKFNEYLDFDILTKYEGVVYQLETEIVLDNLDYLLETFEVDREVLPYKKYRGGYSEAIIWLTNFFDKKIHDYEKRSDPSLEIQSYLSMYLHFGQISVLEIIDFAQKKYKEKTIDKIVFDEFIEQLVVRRELAFNFVTYQKEYDVFEFMTENWAYETINKHETDSKEYLYSLIELENSKTHDLYWNAAMDEMRITGFMANYMRMYWAKKIMEWSKSMKEAYETICYLNNKYFIDGRDANSYVNIAWCFGKMDRPWQERSIFGTLRYMNKEGLKRKFKIDEYVELINKIKNE